MTFPLLFFLAMAQPAAPNPIASGMIPQAVAVVGPARIYTNRYYFALTAYNALGLESPFSNEVEYDRLTGRGITNYSSILLAWDGTNAAGFRLYQGGQSRTYTNILDVGLTNQALVTLVHPLKGFYVTVSVTNGWINYRPSLQSGNWIGTMITSTNLTNGVGSQNFWRGSNAPGGLRPALKFSGRSWFI